MLSFRAWASSSNPKTALYLDEFFCLIRKKLILFLHITTNAFSLKFNVKNYTSNQWIRGK